VSWGIGCGDRNYQESTRGSSGAEEWIKSVVCGESAASSDFKPDFAEAPFHYTCSHHLVSSRPDPTGSGVIASWLSKRKLAEDFEGLSDEVLLSQGTGIKTWSSVEKLKF
jgi:hypothetical protein